MKKSWTMKLRRQSKDGPLDAEFIITPVDDGSELMGSPLIADLEYQANQSLMSLFVGSIPVRVHIFEQETS